MAFRLFRKKEQEPDYDPLNITVKDLRQGFILEYDMRQWMVETEFTYDWGDNYFSKEYKISDGKDTWFLSVEDDDGIKLTLYERIRFSTIDEDIESDIINKKLPPKKIHYKEKQFIRENESPGYFLEENSGKDWVEFINWQYYSEDNKHVLSIEQWGEREFEASFGKIIKSFEISNILPGNQ